MSKRMNRNNNSIFVFLFLILGISFLSLSVSTTIMINAQSSSDSTSGSIGSSSKREGNNAIDPKAKENTDKQMGICVVGAGGPCNGDSNFDGRNDRTGQCILSNGCGNSSNSSNRTVQDKSPNTTSTTNSKSNSSIMVDGLMLK